MATHSVRSLRSPDCLSFHFSVTAMRRFAIRSPDWKVRISASAPRFPMKLHWLRLLIAGPPQLQAAAAKGAPPIRERPAAPDQSSRSEEHTSELKSLMRISYAVFCLKKKNREK